TGGAGGDLQSGSGATTRRSRARCDGTRGARPPERIALNSVDSPGESWTKPPKVPIRGRRYIYGRTARSHRLSDPSLRWRTVAPPYAREGGTMTESFKRWLGVGRSADADGRTAGRDATASAILGRDAKLVIVFCSDSFDLEALLAGIEVSAPGV